MDENNCAWIPFQYFNERNEEAIENCLFHAIPLDNERN